MKTCYKCGGRVESAQCEKEGVMLKCMRCLKCGEEYFTSSELLKFDVLTGKRKMVRKFGVLGDSTIMRIPSHVLKSYKIEAGDYGIFEEKPEGILIKPLKASELKLKGS
ncbi:MAG: AbrB/MazE/SpoVT family DNA-binding domain-containing protein [Nanoarchaeota archaeon]|nr:AbrB/MazE/SpoVT family DNA-binding domain-containing protein [Nanoarchaeota archaeon]